VTDLTEATFSSFVNTHSEGVLVDFYMPGCVHCEQLSPEFEAAAKSHKEKKPGSDGGSSVALTFATVDGAAQPALATKYELKRYPTVLLFKKGEIVQELPPMSRSAEKITEFVNWVQQPAVVSFESKQFEEAVDQLRASMHEKSPPVVVGFGGAGRETLFPALEHIGERTRGKMILLFADDHRVEGEPANHSEAYALMASVPLRSYSTTAETDTVGPTELPASIEAINAWIEGLLATHTEVVNSLKKAESAASVE